MFIKQNYSHAGSLTLVKASKYFVQNVKPGNREKEARMKVNAKNRRHRNLFLFQIRLLASCIATKGGTLRKSILLR